MRCPHGYFPRHVLDTLSIIAFVLLAAFAALPLYGGGALPAALPQRALPSFGPAAPAPACTIVLDAGHGGADGGAVGSCTGVAEAGLNLAVTELLAQKLQAAGLAVILTREDEKALAPTKQADMQARRAIMEQPGVDMVLSIHMNTFSDPSVKGPMAFYMVGSTAGEQLAQCVIAALCEATGSPLRKANPGDYFVLRAGSAPSVLVECGFLSNRGEEALLQDAAYQDSLAEGIAAGVLAYLEGQASSPLATPEPGA